jgi:hypothetical protein
MSQPKTLNKQDLKKILHNFIVFNLFPFLSVFFGQLALEINWKTALTVASLTLWSTLADTFKKWAYKTK